MQNAPDTSNYVYLAMTANFWGSGKTEKEALRNCREAGGSSMIEKYGYATYRVHPDFDIEGSDGRVMTPIGHPAIKVTDAIKRKAKTTA